MKKIILTMVLLSVNLFGQGFSNSKGSLHPFFSLGQDSTIRVKIGIPISEIKYDSSGVKRDTGKTVILLDGGTMGSKTFVTGWQNGVGWELDYDDSSEYNATFDNLTIRGTLAVYELLINQIRATNGNLLVTSVAKVDSIIDAEIIHFEDVTGHGVVPFAVGDMIMCQVVNLRGASFDGNGDIADNQYLVKRLVYEVTQVSGQYIVIAALSGAPANKGTPRKGDTFVRFGSTSDANRRGVVGIYTDEENSPYIRVTDGVNSWSAWKSLASVKLQLGNLTGLSGGFTTEFPDMGSGEYGLFAKGGIYLINGKIALADSGYIRAGQTNFNEGSGFWLGKQNGVAKFSVGDTSGHHISWDGDSLYIVGSLFITDTSSTVDSLRGRIGAAEATLSLHTSTLDSLGAEIVLKANTNTTDSLRSRISGAEVNISATQDSIGNLRSSINLKANTNTTDSLRSRIGSAEIVVSAHSDSIGNLRSAINLKANENTTDSLRSRINTAEVNISATQDSIGNLRSAINLKANTNTTDSLRSRVNNAEVNISATQDSIGNLRSAINLKASTNTTDSLRSRISGAEVNISATQDSIGNLRSSINLKTNITTTDSLKSRMGNAELSLQSKSDSLYNIYVAAALKADITITDSLGEIINDAGSGVVATAQRVDSLGGALSTNLLLYAKKDSIISSINLTPEAIKIASGKIQIDGDVTFASGYDPSQKTDSSKVVTIIDGRVTANYVNAFTIFADTITTAQLNSHRIIADTVIANVSLSSPTITGGIIKTGSVGMQFNTLYFYDLQTGETPVAMMSSQLDGSVSLSSTFHVGGHFSTNGIIWGQGFKAYDGSAGATNTTGGLTFKDGLYISGSVTPAGLPDDAEHTGEYLKTLGGGTYAWDTPTGGGTVTSVALSVPTGLSISGSPITTTGTLAVSLTAGYVIPSTTDISNGNTAYGWGNHASVGYLTSEVDGSTSNELQTLSWDAEVQQLAISSGNSINIPYSGLYGIPSTFTPASHNNSAHSETYITDGNTNWDNSYGFITGNQSITLSGDASGTGTTAITVTVADNSHSHLWANISDKPSTFAPTTHDNTAHSTAYSTASVGTTGQYNVDPSVGNLRIYTQQITINGTTLTVVTEVSEP